MDDQAKNGTSANRVHDLLALYWSIVEGSPLPMAALVGPRHIVRCANPAFLQMVGKSGDEVIGVPFAITQPEDSRLSILERIYRTGASETFTAPEHSEAQPVYRTFAMWPIFLGNKSPVGVMLQVTETARLHQQAIAMNEELLLSGVRQHELTEVAEKLSAQLQLEITERKLMERALVNSEKLAMASRFAMTMAHEINNPLEAITNLLYLLSSLQTSPEARSYINTMDEQLKGLTRIATQMLKFHRDSNKPTEFTLSTMIRELCDFYAPKALSQGVVVNQRIETEGVVVAFRSEIVQVITNLLLNALDATAATHGQITVHLYPAPPWLCEAHKHSGYCISISDTGSGIDNGDRKRIFQPFFTTKGDKGTGLGLWVSLGIVTRVGGSLRVWSRRRPGRSGTCFALFLPVD